MHVTKRLQTIPDPAQAILDLRLHRLTGLEQEKIIEEYKKVLDLINDYTKILSRTEVLMDNLNELHETLSEDGDSRLTEINNDYTDLVDEDQYLTRRL